LSSTEEKSAGLELNEGERIFNSNELFLYTLGCSSHKITLEDLSALMDYFYNILMGLLPPFEA